REMRGITGVLGRVAEAPEVGPVEADLRHVRPRLADELQVLRVAVPVPVGHEPAEFETRGLLGPDRGNAPEGHDQERPNDRRATHLGISSGWPSRPNGAAPLVPRHSRSSAVSLADLRESPL